LRWTLSWNDVKNERDVVRRLTLCKINLDLGSWSAYIRDEITDHV
jgi:hypothetical protein